MNRVAITVIWVLWLGIFLAPLHSFGQKSNKEITPEEVEEYKERVRQLVSFVEFALNAIGDPITTTREKETIINQSYLKAFRDNKVIIEDDLDDNRAMITNKNVQSYLKDIDFFFREVRIEFDIQTIEYQVNDLGKDYFKVTLNRILNGITLNYDTVKTIKPRYIEVNLNETTKDLKIASIYTTRLSEKEELISWWYSLSGEWKEVLQKEIGAYDSVDFRLIQQVAKLEKIDVSNNRRITNLNDIGRLSELKELNVSNTSINDLLPLRNLTRLNKLDFSHTKVRDLEPLKYSVSLSELYFNSTQIDSLDYLENLQSLEVIHAATNPINNLEPLKNLQNLKSIDFSETQIGSLDAVDSLYNLYNLNVARTYVVSLEPLKNLGKLERLNIEGSQVRTVEPIKDLPNLKIVICNNTPLNSIESLNDSPALERIYCDNTLVTRSQANTFMSQNPNVLVIFKSDLLKQWWTELNDTWKKIFIQQVGVSENPDKEELARIAKVNTIDISGLQNIVDLVPLSILENLKSVSLANTGINDLSPLRELDKLEYVDCSYNPIKSLDALSYLRNLKVVNVDKTQIENLSGLAYHGEIELLYCDDTPIENQHILDFADKYPSLLIIHKTDSLISWWNDLDEEWIKVFNRHLKPVNTTATVSAYQAKGQINIENIPTRENLHKIASLQVISILNNPLITHVQPLSQLINLRSLQIINTHVSDLSPIGKLHKLTSLNISNNPITDISPIKGLSQIKFLNFSNTPVEILDPISEMPELEELDISGTQIKNLNALVGLYQLKTINFSNTSVRSLSPIEYHDKLVKVSCFNTRLTSRRVDKFKGDHPNVEVRFY